jgi:hypothetical protein
MDAKQLKRQILEAALRRGKAEVWTKSGTILQLSWRAGMPLEINDFGVSGTRYQSGRPTTYSYPWSDVPKIVEIDGKEHIFRRES